MTLVAKIVIVQDLSKEIHRHIVVIVDIAGIDIDNPINILLLRFQLKTYR